MIARALVKRPINCPTPPRYSVSGISSDSGRKRLLEGRSKCADGFLDRRFIVGGTDEPRFQSGGRWVNAPVQEGLEKARIELTIRGKSGV